MQSLQVIKTQHKPRYNFSDWNDHQENKRDKKKHDRSNRQTKRNYE